MPGAEPLESRDCPSAPGAQVGVERPVAAMTATDQAAPQVTHAHHHASVASHRHHWVIHKKTLKGGPQVFLVTANRKGPHSLATALKLAKSGATLYLAPGVYTGRVGMIGKSNITIVGAPNETSILAPPSGPALKITSSTNITIQNVWFRSSGSGGIGLVAAGSSVNVANIKTDGTYGDGVVVTSYAGRPGVLTATSSHFDGSQTGDGLHLENNGGAGSSAVVYNCTFNNNQIDTNAPDSTLGGNGLALVAGTSVDAVNSQFNGNTNEGLVAHGNGHVTVTGSTFSGNVKGNGALIFDTISVTLTGNTFSSNGKIVSITQGLNGIEFYGVPGMPHHYTGTAVVSGNSFVNNTGIGIYVGSAGPLTISDNQFSGNLVGVFLDGTGASFNASVVGNTIAVAPGSPSGWQGIVVDGPGVTATIGGAGGDANTIENFMDGVFIFESTGGGANAGSPHATILANNYLRNGSPVDPSAAIHRA